MKTRDERRRIAIATQAVLLVQRHGNDIRSRGRSVLLLMERYGISDRSACQFLANAKKRIEVYAKP